MNPSLGDFIRQRREELKLTQRQVALHVGFRSIAHLSDIEGQSQSGPELMPKFAEILQVPLETLLDHDVRSPLHDTRKLLEDRPELVAAFRRVVHQARDLTPEELLRRLGRPDA